MSHSLHLMTTARGTICVHMSHLVQVTDQSKSDVACDKVSFELRGSEIRPAIAAKLNLTT